MYSKRLFLNFFIAFLVLLTGCATTNPYEGDARIKSDALLKQQLSVVDQQGAGAPAGRILFAGFAMNSQSKAFRADVVTTEKLVRSIDPNAVIFKLNNPVSGQEADWPFATAENMSLVLTKLTALARPQDKVVILMSTHGNVDLLSIHFDGKYYPHITSAWLNQTLTGLRGKQTMLILSACYSGSFIEPVSGPSRIVLTASAKDRNSFGCQFQSNNTYFIDALINQSDMQDRSVIDIMNKAKVNVEKREVEQKLSPPSMPQMSVGNAARAWANQPLKNWLKP
jgi:Peptidase C13 family